MSHTTERFWKWNEGECKDVLQVAHAFNSRFSNAISPYTHNIGPLNSQTKRQCTVLLRKNAQLSFESFNSAVVKGAQARDSKSNENKSQSFKIIMNSNIHSLVKKNKAAQKAGIKKDNNAVEKVLPDVAGVLDEFMKSTE